MSSRTTRIIAWCGGLAAVGIIVWYFRPPDFTNMLTSVGAGGIAAWVALTICARVLLAETTVEPLRALGYDLRRVDAFWIGWIRTFANQVLPLSGVVAYSQALRNKTGIAWAEIAALATPQYVLAASALGLIGMVAVSAARDLIPEYAVLLGAVFALVFVASLAVARGAPWLLAFLPEVVARRIRKTTASLARMANNPYMLARLLLWHGLALVLRGGRLWILFAAAGVTLDWEQMLLLIAIAEASFLVQLTPGGLGLREGALLGAAALLGIDLSIAAGVAVIDRLFMIAIIVLMTPPGVVVLSGKRL